MNKNKFNKLKEKYIKKGIEIGRHQSDVEIATTMILNQEPIDKIMAYTGLYIEKTVIKHN